ncbi:penicillin-binding transpeptidase domain-containing protein [Xanthobacter sp. 91]|uniref:penicillin-binding transpeptidase domain-containing protein n=1 Tax=Xanthobacter sp. 91 TaxID=1117244 RepID=UPI0009E0ABBE|nr:penicillin-binding transpeptidase domain-containing protein [Xanthobacter sp. 91]
MGRMRSGAATPLARLALTLSLVLAPALLGMRPATAAEDCLLVTDLDSGRVLAKQGLCAARHPPNSTFKVVLALMGYDAGILKSDSKPVYEPPPGADLEREVTRGPQTPRSWMKNSVVWYSEVLAAELGHERMAHYLKVFTYGNENMGGVKGEAEPGKRYWISSSLVISPREQIDFLRRMLKGQLPVSADAVEETIRIMAIDEQPAGWLTFGKTGSGFGRFPDGRIDRSRPFGWFVGFARKDGHTAVFVRYTSLDMASPESLGLVARRQMLAALVPVLSAQAP